MVPAGRISAKALWHEVPGMFKEQQQGSELERSKRGERGRRQKSRDNPAQLYIGPIGPWI